MTLSALSTYLINAAWQAPLVALTVFLVAWFSGLTPSGRHRLWLGGLATAALLPAVSFERLLQVVPTVARVAPTTVVVPVRLPATDASAAPDVTLAPWMAWAMVAVAATVALLLVIRLTSAALAARRLVATGRPAVLPAEALRAVQTFAASHGRRAPPVLATTAVDGPVVVGALRPTILIPTSFDVSPEDLRAALLHETAHVVRHDYAVNLACELLTLPVAWHPAVAALKAGVRRSREMACDAMAAEAMSSPKTYAQSLLSLARTLARPSASTQPALAVGLFGRSDLEDRLMHLLTPRDPDGAFVQTARACGLTVVAASLLGAAALLHVTPVFAEPAPPKAPAPPAVAATALAPAAPPAQPAPPAPPAKRRSVVIKKDGVLIEAGQTGRRHSWTAADGTPMAVVTDSDQAPTAEQQRQWEAYAREAEAKAARVEAMVNSPEFKARIEKAKEAGKRAEAMMNSPEFKARMERVKADMERSRADMERARAVMRDARVKAAIARAQAHAAAFDTPEFRRQMEELGRQVGSEVEREVEREMARDPS